MAGHMAISPDYPHPIVVNGFSCRNCTDVDRARRNIDPAVPRAGPFGLNDPQRAKTSSVMLVRRMDELAMERANLQTYSAAGPASPSSALGTIVDRLG